MFESGGFLETCGKNEFYLTPYLIGQPELLGSLIGYFSSIEKLWRQIALMQ